MISNEILALLNSFKLDNAEDIARQVADDFRKRRVEKNISRRRIAELSGVPISSVARFEQKGLIAFESLIRLAMALGYTPEVKKPVRNRQIRHHSRARPHPPQNQRQTRLPDIKKIIKPYKKHNFAVSLVHSG